MKTISRWCAVSVLMPGLLVPAASAQTLETQTQKSTTHTTRKTTRVRQKRAAAPAVTAEDIKSLRDAVTAQQQQMQQLRSELERRDQQIQAMQQQLQQTQTSATEVNSKLTEAESATSRQQEVVGKLEADMNDVRSTLTNTALNAQEDQKKFSALEGVVNRFRLTGDVRVRQEDFFQSLAGCGNNCAPRVRERIRLRVGMEGKLSEDFTGGVFLATGALTDPTSTNETLTGMLERKNIGFDRGYITYNPHAHKWLSLTGGKFAYTWIRTPQTFDNDINPEGFSEKFSFDLKNTGFLKNVTLTGMQLLFSEVNRGVDTFAVGGQVSTRLQPTGRWTVTPSYSLLNWRNEDAIFVQPPSVTGASTATAIFAPNGLTNLVRTVNGRQAFQSRFLYSDLIVENTIKTNWSRWPVRVLAEYLDNLRAATNASHLYLADVAIGQTKEQGDWQFGYGIWRQEQDSAIASFVESDQRAPTNVLQQRAQVNYQVRNNITAGFSGWFGRTLDSTKPRAVLLTGVQPGQKEPYLKRLQFDVIYKF